MCNISIMPCALSANLDYPNYIKNLLKQVTVGNDERLKVCACQLKTPSTNEGCPILDENSKVGLFPFCVETTTSDPKSIEIAVPGLYNINFRRPYRVGLKLKELMNLYWRAKNFKIAGSTTQTNNLNCSVPPQPPFWEKNSFQNSITKNTQNLNSMKDLICFSSLPETITHTAKGSYSNSQGNSAEQNNAFTFNLKFKETVYYYESDQKFYPNIEITFYHNYYNGFSVGPWSFLSSPPIPSGPCYGQISNLSINGDIFQNQGFGVLIGCGAYYEENGDPSNCQDTGEMSGEIDIEINSYRS